jgi:thiol:disulfide interchange protein DsbD
MLLCLPALPARAFHTHAQLVLDQETARAGDTVLAGLVLRMDAHWHTYWKNPGASGMATTIAWQLPTGVSAGAIAWPVPEKTPDQDLTTYIYRNEVVLLVPLKLAADLPPGPLALKAKVSWLECETVCVLGDGNVQASLNIGAEPKPSGDAPLLGQWKKVLPQTGEAIAARAWWDQPATNSPRSFLLEWNSSSTATDPDFFPDSGQGFEVQADTEKVSAEAGKVRLRKAIKKYEGEWPARISGVIVEKSGDQRLAYDVSVPLGPSAAAGSSPANGPGPAPAQTVAAPSLWATLFSAFLGGLILNVMPCVLPVIALKILGFVAQAKEDPRRVRRLGLIYALGVLVSFLTLAGLAIGIEAAGHQAGWGMQFANPQFLVIMTVLVTLIALNLFGVFEINAGGRVIGAAGELASKHGAAGAFFNGLLATVLGTSCTAPFLAGALGFAFAQPPWIILLVSTFVALGMALPYLLLSFQPAWLKFLPRPGRWMERFKVAMGFPMLATAVWLFSLIPAHYGKRALWLGLFLIMLALAAWVYGEFVQRAAARRGLGLAVVLVLLLGGYAYAIEGRLRWRSPEAQTAQRTLKESPDGIDWQPWSPAAVDTARNEGRPVLVDFTADWCVNCQINKNLALEIPSVRAKLKAVNALALLGDYTNTPENISSELRRYRRAGVPLVLVFPRNKDQPAIVLPSILTPGIVLNALQKAAGS